MMCAHSTTQILTLFFSILLLSITTNNIFAQCEEYGYELSTSTEDVNCYGDNAGQATVASTGCDCIFSGCTFQWSSGHIGHTAEHLEAGEYSVTVTHIEGCVLTATVVINGPDAPFIENIEVEQISCAGNTDGLIRVVPTTTAGPLTFNWSNGMTDNEVNSLAPGDYALTVTNFMGCQYTKTIEIQAPAELELSVEVGNACNGQNNGTATVKVSGGTPPYDVQWNDPLARTTETIMELETGIYSVVVSDANGCEKTYNEVQVINAMPVATVQVEQNNICPNESVQLTATGGAVYTWSPATGLDDAHKANPIATLSATRTYTVTVETLAGCSSTESITIDVENGPEPNIIVFQETIYPGESTQLIATEPNGATFSWSPAEGLNNPNINAPTASPSVTTTYTVTATIANGCTATKEVTIFVESVVGIEDATADEHIRVYPNPANDVLNIALHLQEIQDLNINIFNTVGQVMYQENRLSLSGTYAQQFDISAYQSGLYYVVITAGQERITKKVMVY